MSWARIEAEYWQWELVAACLDLLHCVCCCCWWWYIDQSVCCCCCWRWYVDQSVCCSCCWWWYIHRPVHLLLLLLMVVRRPVRLLLLLMVVRRSVVEEGESPSVSSRAADVQWRSAVVSTLHHWPGLHSILVHARLWILIKLFSYFECVKHHFSVRSFHVWNIILPYNASRYPNKTHWSRVYYTHARLTALCPGLPGWASTKR